MKPRRNRSEGYTSHGSHRSDARPDGFDAQRRPSRGLLPLPLAGEIWGEGASEWEFSYPCWLPNPPQQKIDPTRAREIQEALIREHYLDGTASGTWDAKSQSAMQRYQADNGWQSKSVPDSRALIKMGLGPDHEHLLNPESAMTSRPEAPRASPMLSPAMAIPPQK